VGAASDQERHVLGLDLIRFAAASLVMVFHYGHDVGPIPLSWGGWVGVEVFFVLSGYVISASSEGSAPWTFARNRLVRLMPAVWLCSSLIAIVCVARAAYPDLGARYMRSMVLWPMGSWVDGAFWTLPVEVAFYALVFLCLLGKARLAWLLRAIAIVSFAFWALRLGSQYQLETVADHLPESFARFSMLSFGCYFAVGGLMREVLTRGPNLERLVFLALSVTGGTVQIAFAGSNWPPEGWAAAHVHAGKIVPALVWLGLVAAMAASVMGNVAAWRRFAPAAPAIRLLGLTTYPLYLMHETIGNALKWTPALRTPLVASGLAIVVSVAFASAIEPPAQRWLRRALDGLASLPSRRAGRVPVDRAVG
jgi:exopolysaccharide production protein ExoZ